MSASAVAAIAVADIELHFCPSIEEHRWVEGLASLSGLLEVKGMPGLKLDGARGCRNDMVYGLVSGDFSRDQVTVIGQSVRAEFGSGYGVFLVDQVTHEELFDWPATS